MKIYIRVRTLVIENVISIVMKERRRQIEKSKAGWTKPSGHDTTHNWEMICGIEGGHGKMIFFEAGNDVGSETNGQVGGGTTEGIRISYSFVMG